MLICTDETLLSPKQNPMDLFYLNWPYDRSPRFAILLVDGEQDKYGQTVVSRSVRFAFDEEDFWRLWEELKNDWHGPRVTEVYDFTLPLDEQFGESRALHGPNGRLRTIEPESTADTYWNKGAQFHEERAKRQRKERAERAARRRRLLH